MILKPKDNKSTDRLSVHRSTYGSRIFIKKPTVCARRQQKKILKLILRLFKKKVIILKIIDCLKYLWILRQVMNEML